MPFEIPVLDLPHLSAAADLSAKQFFIVKRTGVDAINVAGAGEQCYGVLQDNPVLNDEGRVRVYGVTKVVAGGVIAEGDPIASDAAGKAKAAVKGSTNTADAGVAADPVVGSYVLGIALESAAADGDVISMLITHAGLLTTVAS